MSLLVIASETYSPNCPQAPRAKPGDRVLLKPNGGGVDCHTNDCWGLSQGGGGAGRTVLELLGADGVAALSTARGAAPSAARSSGPELAPSTALCLTASGSTYANLTVDVCTAGWASQQFTTTNHSTPADAAAAPVAAAAAATAATAATAAAAAVTKAAAASSAAASSAAAVAATAADRVTHVQTGLCVTSPEESCAGCPATLQDCAAPGSATASRQLWLFGASGRLCATAYNSLCLHADAQWPAWWQVAPP